MKRTVSMLIAILFWLASAAVAQQPAASADDVSRRAADILGGGGAWEKARYISFTFKVERNGKVVASFPQEWDRYTGQYRVSGEMQDGTPFRITLNVNTKMGHASIKGEAVTDQARFKELYEIGYRRFLNDTNWLVMPLKVFDPGVHRAYEGQRTNSCGRTWDLVKLTFDAGVGLPTGDTYWMWIDRETGMVNEWDIKPYGAKRDEPIEVFLHEYRRIGGLLLSVRREIRGKGETVRLDDVTVLPAVPKGAFE